MTKAEIVSAGVDEHTLEDVGGPAQMRPAHAAGVVGVSKAAFDAFASAS